MNAIGVSQQPIRSLSLVLAVGIWVLSWLLTTGIDSAVAAPSSSGTKNVEMVQGSGCYAYGDDETPAKAKKAARILAQEQAVRSHTVYIKSQSRIKNFQLDEDIIQATSAAILRNIVVLKEEKKSQEICVSLSAPSAK